MKRLLSLATLLLLLVSCTAEIDQQFGGSRASAPGNKPVFQASVEGCVTPETKVYADENMKVLWNADDRISIFNMTTLNAQYAFTGDDGDTAGGFEWVSETGSDADIDFVYAVYPYKESTTISTDGLLTTTLPAEQAYKVHSFGIGANTMVAVTDGTFLAFKNVGGYLSLRFYGDDISVRRITIRGNNGEKIAGQGTIEMAMGGTPTVTMDNAATDAVSIVCDPAVKLGKSAERYTEFWFVIPPVTFTGGFTITVVDEMGGVFTKSTTKSFTVSRNTLDWMSALKVVPDYDNVNIEFEDANFKAYCVANFDGNSDGEISGSEVADVKTVNVCTDNIKSIKGIEFFASLESLTCKGSKIGTKGPGDAYAGQLESIDVSKNVHLWELDCSGNKIEEVDVSNNPELQTLICNDNPIEEVILAPDQVIATLESPVSSNVVYEWEDADVPAADEIWYTTSDGAIITLKESASFGDVTVVSNTYADGKGILKFSGPLTTIGRYTFYTCKTLTSVTLPEGLISIGAQAFSLCNSMVSVTIPSTLTEIQEYAFWNCHKLTYVTIPEHVTVLGDGIFAQCFSLTAIQGQYATTDKRCLIKDGRLLAFAPAGLTAYTIPSNVTSIGDQVFRECLNLESVVIPEGVTSLGFTAFGLCRSLEQITIPQSVTSIGNNVFEDCRSLQSVNGKFASDDNRCLIVDGKIIAFARVGLTEYTIPSSVTHIEFGVFTDCNSLTSITIPENVTYIEEYAFAGCTSLTGITVLAEVPPTFPSWTDQPESFFDTNNCPIYVPAASLTAYKQAVVWRDYADRIKPMSGAVPSSFPDEKFRAYIFDNYDSDKDGKLSETECDAVTSITVCTDSIATVKGIEAFQNLSYLYCAGTDSYNNGSFTFNGQLTSLDVSNNQNLQYLICDHNQLSALDVTHNTKIERLSCHGNQLTSLDLSKNLALGDLSCGYNQLTALDVSKNTALFYLSCNKNQLTSLDLSNNTVLETLGFNNNQLTSIDVRNNTALLTLDCAKNQLTSIDVSANTALAYLQIDDNPITDLNVSNNTALKSLCCRYNQLSSLDVSNNIALNTLWCMSNRLTSLDVSNNTALTNLDCRYNSNLSTLYLATGQEIATLAKDSGTEIVYISSGPASNEIWYTTTDGEVFDPSQTDGFGAGIVSNNYSDGKGVIRFDGPVTQIGRQAFHWRRTLKSMILPEGITIIAEDAFNGCIALESIVLPSTLNTIGVKAFQNCHNLSSITIPENVSTVGDAVFSSCSGLATIKGKHATSDHKCLIIDGRLIAFAPAGVTSCSIPSGVTSIGDQVFHECRYLKSITIPEGVTSIGYTAFGFCESLESITIPQSVTRIGNYAFQHCKALGGFYGKYTSDDHHCLVVDGRLVGFARAGLTEYSIPADVEYIDYGVFTDCTSLECVTIPAAVFYIADYAFAGCTSLSSITVFAAVPPSFPEWMEQPASFDDTNNCPIYVPASVVDTYKTASGWSDYASRIQPAAPLPTVVDLGLSVKWATFNLGASSPTGSGNSYAWGETQPKSSYSWENYKWCKGTENTLTKYCYDSTYGNEGYTDAKGTLDLADDAAAANLGGSWRMPTVDEYLELRNTSNCDWTWNENYQDSGVSGYVVTSKKEGYTDKFIFIPAVSLWTSSISTSKPFYAYDPWFSSSQVQWSSAHRYFGHAIRPVYTE